MDYYYMMQGRMRHEEMIKEAQREAYFDRLGLTTPGIFSQIASVISSIFTRRAQTQATARRLATK
jgi:hypothetical protein